MEEKKTLPEFLAKHLGRDFDGETSHTIYAALLPHMEKEAAFIVARDGNMLRSHVAGSMFSVQVASKAPQREIALAAQERAVKLAGEAATLRIELRVYLRGLGYVF